MSDEAADNQPHEIVDANLAPATQSEQEQNKAAADFEKHHGNAGEISMEVKVHSPFKSYYDGLAFSISGVNATGPFDILPRHHNFITLLDPCELVVRSKQGDEKIQIGGGIMHVKADKVIVFLDV
jgi:hypothetical protein